MTTTDQQAMEAAWEVCLDRGQGKKPFAKGFFAGLAHARTGDSTKTRPAWLRSYEELNTTKIHTCHAECPCHKGEPVPDDFC